MPWTRTSAYPQAFMVPAFEMGPGFNYSTYVLYDSIMCVSRPAALLLPGGV